MGTEIASNAWKENIGSALQSHAKAVQATHFPLQEAQPSRNVNATSAIVVLMARHASHVAEGISNSSLGQGIVPCVSRGLTRLLLVLDLAVSVLQANINPRKGQKRAKNVGEGRSWLQAAPLAHQKNLNSTSTCEVVV